MLVMAVFLLFTSTGCSKGRKLVNLADHPEAEITSQSKIETKSEEKKEKIEKTKVGYWELAVWRARAVAYTVAALISGYIVFQLADGINNFKREEKQ